MEFHRGIAVGTLIEVVVVSLVLISFYYWLQNLIIILCKNLCALHVNFFCFIFLS